LQVAGCKLLVLASNAPNLQLVTEKWPFFALMAAFCVVTCWIQHDYAAMTPWAKLGLGPRVANAISGYLTYPAQLFWPLHLAAIYPYPKDYDVPQTVLKAALLLALSLGCLMQLPRRPWLAVGWFWYVGTALPVIGIVQVGEQAMADRYTYLPLIGPVIALVWTAAEIFSRGRGGKIFLTAATVLILSTLAVLSARQLQFWRNTIALFAHNVAVTPDNGSAHFTLGLGYEHAGDTNRAVVCYRVAKALSPGDLQIRRSLASLLARQGQFAAAEAEYAELLAMQPDDFDSHAGLAGVFARRAEPLRRFINLTRPCSLIPIPPTRSTIWLGRSPPARARNSATARAP
jgi:tetratricopeptide (TPR) repeat protein